MVDSLLTRFAAACTPTGGDVLGFPKWYKYLSGTEQADGSCAVSIGALSDVWKVAAAIFELLLRLGALVAVFFILWGAFTLMMAQGEPERIKNAKGTIINAIVGLLIAVFAATVVAVVAGRLT